jgi:hypothetical protein
MAWSRQRPMHRDGGRSLSQRTDLNREIREIREIFLSDLAGLPVACK